MTDSPQDSSDSNAATAAEPAPAARRSNAALLLLNLLLLGGVAALGSLSWQQRQTLETLAGDSYSQQQSQASLEQRLASAEAGNRSLASELAALRQAQASANDPTEAAVATLRGDLEALRRELLTRTANSTQDWSRLEAAALLRLARQQALNPASLPSAIRLYQDVANLLRRSSDADLQPLRAAVQLELDALRSLELPPLDELYLQLGQLARQLDSLQVQSEGEAKLQFTAPAPDAQATAAGWWEQLKQALSRYFVVRRQDTPLLAQLTPEQAFLIRQQIRLQLESARLALLQGDSSLYQAALDAANTGITEQLQGEGKAAVLASLQRLRNTAIAPALPNLGAALRTLEQLDAAAAAGATP